VFEISVLSASVEICTPIYMRI